MAEPLPRLYQQIARSITSMIRSGELRKGDRLPAERDLAVRLSVSRSSVREAVIALEIAGVVDVRIGSGTYVLRDGYSSSAMLGNFLANDPGPGPFEIIEVRRLIETETAFRAASHATQAQLNAIAAAVDMMRESGAPGSLCEAGDRAFHILIAEASGNSAFALVLRDLWTAMSLPLWKHYQDQVRTHEMHVQRLAEHEAILQSLIKRDPMGARAAIAEHFDRVMHRFARLPDLAGHSDAQRQDAERLSVATN